MSLRTAAQALSLVTPLSVALLVAPPAGADEMSEQMTAAAGERETELQGERFASPAALCKAYVARAKDVRASSPPHHDESIVAHAPRCVAEATSLPFTGTRTWKSLRVAHVDDGIGRASRLLLETPSGWHLGPMAWNERDPRDPGCPSIVRDISVHGAGVQNGRLVVIMAGERTTYVEPTSEDDHGGRTELVRTPWWATESNGDVSFRSTQTFLSGGILGSKVQPTRRWVDWSTIPWSGLRTFHVEANGEVRVAPDGQLL
jgi:hypothetical protein